MSFDNKKSRLHHLPKDICTSEYELIWMRDNDKIFIDRFRKKSATMWNGKCNLAKEAPPGMVQNNLNIRNGPWNDTSSMRSVSSEDISTSDLPTLCCNSNATNPAIKSGRRFQLLQVKLLSLYLFKLFKLNTFYAKCMQWSM